MALSAEGDTALIGGPSDDSRVGAAWVFTRSGSTSTPALTWTQQGPKLTGAGETGDGELGSSVALSAEGDTALIGGPSDDGDGTAWMFSRSGSTWTQQGPKLTGAGETGDGEFGSSVALSAEGDTALIGGPHDLSAAGGDDHAGAAWVFATPRPGCTDSWTNTAGGSWFTAGDWSRGAPPGPEEAACITAPGTYTVTMEQTSATGMVGVRSLTIGAIGATASTQTLVVASTCTENAILATTYGIANRERGVIAITNGDRCANSVTLAGSVGNVGKLYAEDPEGGARSIEGNLTNDGVVSLAAGVSLRVAGGYRQTPTGRLRTFIAGASDCGSLSVADGASLAGTLAVRQTSPFKASLGQAFAILGGASVAGAFATETGDQIDYFTYTRLYYRPTYSATAVTLVATTAKVSLSAHSGLPGAAVTVKGSGYLPGDTITPTFTDHDGVKTVLPSVTTKADGRFSTEIAIPTLAAAGIGTITITSAQTGVKVNRPFTVTA